MQNWYMYAGVLQYNFCDYCRVPFYAHVSGTHFAEYPDIYAIVQSLVFKYLSYFIYL